MAPLALVLALLIPTPAHPHTEGEQRAWEQEWVERVKEGRGLTIELIAEYRDFQVRHQMRRTEPTSSSSPSPWPLGMGKGVEQWRGLVEAYFGAETDLALCVMAGESGGNPTATNPTSGAAGLFQIMPFWWEAYGGDRYDPEENVRMAAFIRQKQGWNAWTVYSRGECG